MEETTAQELLAVITEQDIEENERQVALKQGVAKDGGQMLGLVGLPDASKSFSFSGKWGFDLRLDNGSGDEPRGSSPVLRGTGGEIPPVYSPGTSYQNKNLYAEKWKQRISKYLRWI
ncbi:MAG: hypothetical protein P4L69_24530 [Desulfosporosinus sp.]|nr:hypothetical protein [Desulfosporosinus sp.]